MPEYRVRIDRDNCISCMVCVSMCGEVFEMSEEDGKSQIVERFRYEGKKDEGRISEDLVECVKKAVDSCPVNIIHLEEVG